MITSTLPISFKGTTKIFATTDPHQETRRECAFLSLAAQASKRYDNILFLNAGDLFKGIYPKETEVESYLALKKAAPNMEVVIALGNNDFGFDKNGLDFLKKTAERFEDKGIHVVCANVFDKETGERPDWMKPYKVVERDGDRIMVTGFCINSINNTAQGVKAVDSKEILKELKKDIEKEKPDALIILNHDWISNSNELADFAKEQGIKVDLMVGGHEHDRIEPNSKKRIYYPHAFANTMYKMDMEIQDGINRLKNVELIENNNLDVAPVFEAKLADAERQTGLLDPVAPYVLNLTKKYSEPCALGSFTADAMKNAAKTDVAFFSTGFLMAPMPYKEGKTITNYDFKKTIIADSQLQKVELTADELKAVFSNAQLNVKNSNARFLQASNNLMIIGDEKDKRFEISQIYLDNKPLFDSETGKAFNPDKKISCAIDPFIANGGQGFDTLKYADKKPLTKILRPLRINDVLMNALKEAPFKYKKGDDYPHFQIHSKKYEDAKKYYEAKTKEYKIRSESVSIKWYDFGKLDGIQEGIEVFDGLSMKEIVFFLTKLDEVGVLRGCHNQCVHCYAEALPPLHLRTEQDKQEKINSMSYEDFSLLTDGIKQLRERLGNPIIKSLLYNYTALFHDADCIDISIKDKNGKEHDFIELSEEILEASGNLGVFDTSGWSPKNKKAQKHAEKIAEYYSKSKNMDKLIAFNISLNPFHAMNAKYVEYVNSDPNRAAKFRELYTDRMANVLYTFTPLIESDKFCFIARSLGEDRKKGYRESDLIELRDEIFKKLENKYKSELKNGNNKFVKNAQFAKALIETLKAKSSYVNNLNLAQGRISNLLKEDDIMLERQKDRIAEYKNTPGSAANDRDFEGFLDANGKLYITDCLTTFPTELQLNFENKDKKTAPIRPALQEKVVTREMIEDI